MVDLDAVAIAQLEQRVKREHGVRFDALVRATEEQMHGDGMAPEVEHDAAESATERHDE